MSLISYAVHTLVLEGYKIKNSNNHHLSHKNIFLVPEACLQNSNDKFPGPLFHNKAA